MSHQDIYDPKDPSMVYLRPNEGARPVKYEEQTHLQGIMLDRKHMIAVYTSRAGMSVGPQGPQGPQGPPGPTGPTAFDTIIASCSNEDDPISAGGPKTTFRAPYPIDMTNGYIRASLTNAPTGSAFIIDITMNGTSVFNTLLSIDAGEKTSVTAATPAVLNIPGNLIPDDAEFLVYVDTQDSGTTASGLKVALTGQKVVV